MRPPRRYASVALGIAFAATTIGFAFFQPFVPGAVWSAFPQPGSLVCKADSLEQLVDTPACQQLGREFSDRQILQLLLFSKSWIRLAAPSEIALGAIPLNGSGGPRFWAAASWVGWRSPWLRWKLDHIHSPGFSFVGKHSVWPVWEYRMPGLANGNVLAFALTDNLFIACLSQDPSHIFQLLDAYDTHKTEARRQP